MQTNIRLSKDQAGLLVIDAQEKLFPLIDRPYEVLHSMQKVIKGFQLLQMPITISEQYPEGLGETIAGIKSCFENQQQHWPKTAFSCIGDPALKKHLLGMSIQQWILIGIEAHVCVLQTAKDLLQENKQVVVLNDAIGSRSIYNFSTAIAEMRDCGIRISSSETILFELVKDSKAIEFKPMSLLMKEASCPCG